MNPKEIFSIKTKDQFVKKTLDVFRFQSLHNPVYKKYIEQIGIVNPGEIKNILKIPFLPIEFYKRHKIISSSEKTPIVFFSSGTSGMERSKHYVQHVSIYQKSFCKCFELFYGNIKQYALLAMLPGYYENKNSSLIYMMMELIKQTKNKYSGFYNTKDDNIIQVIHFLLENKQKVILFGVSFALLEFSLSFASHVGKRNKKNNLLVIETGGMKNKQKEMTRSELHKILCERFKVKKIHSEYGMTELLSQAYSKGNGIFKCPPWMRVFVRDVNDPYRILPPKKTGALNIIDLANIYSCSFIATQDLGKLYSDGSFEVLGRMDNSDMRGCNLMAT